MARGAVVALSHGGGPMPVLGDPTHADMTASMKNRVPKILKLNTPEAPRAIIVVTAHWQTQHPTISSGKSHKLYYDYGGFPAESYSLKYPAPGSPELAAEVKAALDKAGFQAEMDDKRGWDHGVFIPFLLINPAANVPIVQVSVLANQDAAAHLRMGRALAPLRDTNVAIVGSGFASIHHMPSLFALMGGRGREAQSVIARSSAWSARLSEALMQDNETARAEALANWREFPNAYDMHPRGGAEHFLPLLVCSGAGADEKPKSFADNFAGLKVWSYYWE